jgi:hypothetical protein
MILVVLLGLTISWIIAGQLMQRAEVQEASSKAGP